ncbi:MAG TPA: protein kinase [Gemmatimonadales bacterium]|nr:protein kinase [Gemmatimonadales bacterium]
MTDTIDRLSAILGDRYAVDRQVGEGGMATVYLARDVKHDRQVAIKVLKPELAASIGADRFLREIRVAATLQHPNILGLYDSGHAGDLLYYVMPFIEGESLRDRLDRDHQLPLADALQVTREAAEALQYAHDRGIVHRDIKPENILLMGGHALVADFGIARAVSEAGGEKLTRTGMAMGTPHYMSPEQSMGSAQVDARSDVYSLGCVLYELLIGQPPFDGPNAMAIIARHSMEVVPSLQVVRPSVPDDVEDAVMRALEKTPADRFQTMHEFAQCLVESEAEATMTRTASRRTAGGARRTPTRGVAASRARRRKLVIGGAVLVALVAGAGAWVTLRRPPPLPLATAAAGGLDPHRIAVLYFEDFNPRDSLGYLADGLTQGLISELGEVQALQVISPNGVEPYRDANTPADSIARALQVGTLVRGGVERQGNKIRITVRLIDGASGVDYPPVTFERPDTNVIGIEGALVQQVAGMIRQRLGQEITLREQRASTRSAQAWILVQRARAALTRAQADVAQGSDSASTAAEFAAVDSLYREAQAADRRWIEPLAGRAALSYQRAYLARGDPLSAKIWIDQGIPLADSALAIDPQNPDALEDRGKLRYIAWVLQLERDPVAARKLLSDARSDLETATRIRPSQAGAWAILSHLYTNVTDGEASANLAARRAYEADAYLTNANQILARLYLASFDDEDFVAASHWCDEGQRRFPTDFQFVSCRLWLMTSRAREPDPALAWRLADSLATLAPAPRRKFETLKAHVAVAGVLARKGLLDSARSVLARSQGTPEIDPTRDLSLMSAFVETLIGDPDSAIDRLKVYLIANPDQRQNLANDSGWWFRSLRGDPKYEQIVAGR